MSKFIIYIQLHNIESNNDSMLDSAMERNGLSKYIQDNNSEKLYKLPDLQYCYDGDIISIHNILSAVKQIVNKFTNNYDIMITEINDTLFYNYDVIEQ